MFPPKSPTTAKPFTQTRSVPLKKQWSNQGGQTRRIDNTKRSPPDAAEQKDSVRFSHVHLVIVLFQFQITEL